jgi:wyosine [tRNA(Phe)-imidazoG37] synthetase (radical SAM superfamily)
MGDTPDDAMLVFGPIASRRFGRSLGVNNIPPKHCSYSCVYCQLGATKHTDASRRPFYDPAAIAAAVARRVDACREQREQIDVIGFVPAGEPTLDVNLGAEIAAVKRHGIPVAVITNGSLLWMEEVRRDLAGADIVSIEIDTVDPTVWRKLDRPCSQLDLTRVQDGMREFARSYHGWLVTQTMLIRGRNDDAESLRATATFVAELSPKRACLSVPTRPPAESRVTSPDEETLLRAHVIFAARIPHVELLTAEVADVLVATGDAAEDLVAAVTVHPMRQESLVRDGVALELIDRVVAEGRLTRVVHDGNVFLARRVPTAAV